MQIKAKIEGRILEDTIEEFRDKDGVKTTRILSVHQKGSKNLIQIKVPINTDTEFDKDDITIFDVVITDWNINGRTGISIKLAE